MANLLFKTGFEDATKIGSPGKVGERFDFPNYPVQSANNGFVYGSVIGNSWIETGFAHSGTKCGGFQRAPTGERIEWSIWGLESWAGNEIFVRQWVYLPSEFDITEGWWDGIAVLAEDVANVGRPIAELHLRKKNNAFTAEVAYIDLNEVHYLVNNTPITLPRGQWFPLQWHTVRSDAGIIEIWINAQYPDPPTFTVNLDLVGTSTAWYITLAKCYGSQVNQAGRTLWLDDMEIWDGLPSGEVGAYALTVQASDGGAVDVETQDFPVNTPVQVTATPYTNYILDYWLLDGNNVGNVNPITVMMDTNHILKPVFTITPIQAGFPIWTLIPIGLIGAWYALKGKKYKRK